jgi:hypothetical protein
MWDMRDENYFLPISLIHESPLNVAHLACDTPEVEHQLTVHERRVVYSMAPCPVTKIGNRNGNFAIRRTELPIAILDKMNVAQQVILVQGTSVRTRDLMTATGAT